MACGTCTAACLEGWLFWECLLPSEGSLEGNLSNFIFFFFFNFIFFFSETQSLIQAYLKLLCSPG